MRNLIAVPVVCSAVLIASCFAPAKAGVSISVSVGAPVGYSTGEDDPAMDNDQLIILGGSRVGYWMMLPTGRWVLRCRAMWYDRGCDEWQYGPWGMDYSVAYDPHWANHYTRFSGYMNRNYPRYYASHFRDDRWSYRARDERRDTPRGVVRDDRREENRHPQVYAKNEARDNGSSTRVYKSSADHGSVSQKQGTVRENRPATNNERAKVIQPESSWNDNGARNERPARTDGGMRRR